MQALLCERLEGTPTSSFEDLTQIPPARVRLMTDMEALRALLRRREGRRDRYGIWGPRPRLRIGEGWVAFSLDATLVAVSAEKSTLGQLDRCAAAAAKLTEDTAPT